MSGQQISVNALMGCTGKNYEKCLVSEGIPHKQHSYYIFRAKQFIRSIVNQESSLLTTEMIGETLAALGRDNNLADWQFGQLVEAVRILLVVHLKFNEARAVDWTFWKGSARSLASSHPTVAKENAPDELLYLKVKNGTGPLMEIRTQHRKLIMRLVGEIRARGYAYRTEEAY